MIVTKYLGSHLEDILTNCRLKVSRVSKLNDPFEFRYKCVGDFTKKEAENFLQERLKRENFIQLLSGSNEFRGKSEEEIKNHFQENKIEIVNKILETMPDAHRQIIDDVSENADKTIRIICFSKPIQKSLDELLLWSHYARSHSGSRIWINLSLEPLLAIKQYEVKYRDDLVSLDISDPNIDLNSEPIFIKALETKAKCWEYEQEIRVLIDKNYCKLEEVAGETLEYINISLESLTRIDFGVWFPEEERNTLIESLRTNGISNIKFFQCKRSYDKYAIEYEGV